MRIRGAHLRSGAFASLLAALLSCQAGCTLVTYLGTDTHGREHGMTYYLGGAGPFGHVGTLDVPKGLRRAEYEGGIEVFGWQSIVGGTLRDQMDRDRNLDQARRLARRILDYLDEFPGRPINIIALSAGSGIATWALESLPAGVRVEHVVFMGSSLSRDYELGPALAHVNGRLYNFYSTGDSILRYGVPVTGSVDREYEGPAVAGLYGFAFPRKGAALETYRQKVRNMPYRAAYARYGYKGGHTDSTSEAFIRAVVAPLLIAPPAPPETAEESRQPPPDILRGR